MSVYKPQRPENLRDVKGRTVSRLPDDRLAIGRRSLPAEEVDPERIAGRGGTRVHGRVGNPHEGVPGLSGLVDAGGDLESGVPHPSVFVPRSVQIDIEIDPFSLRRDLEFLVATNVLEVRTDKHFGHIPFPQLIGLGVRLWLGFQIELLVGASEKKIQIPARPARPDFAPVSRHRIPFAVTLGEDRRDSAPKSGVRVRIRGGIAWGLLTLDLPGPDGQSGRQGQKTRSAS